jgi:hypothetical protein
MGNLPIEQDQIEPVLLLLAETPARIAAVTAGLSSAQLALSPAPAPGGWSAAEILAHLRGCADVWSVTIREMLRQNEPVLPLHSPRAWAKKKGYSRLDFHASLQVFTAERAELLVLIQPLPVEAWERGALIDGRRHTVFSQARRLALHEQAHCAQIEALSGG